MSTLSVPLGQFAIVHSAPALSIERPPASLPNPTPTRSYWIDTPGANPLASAGSEGDLINDADVCIIGSGITGVSAAYHLANRCVNYDQFTNPVMIKVVIVEARDFCSGATGRNGGHLTATAFLDFHRRKLAYGTDEALRSFALEKYTSERLVQIIKSENLVEAVDLVAGGHTTMFVTDQEAEDARADYDAANAAGLDLENVEWLSKEDMETHYGASYPGVRFPGFNLWPPKLVTELYKLAHKNTRTFSLNLHTRTPVTKISPLANHSFRRWSLSTPRGDIMCSYVIHATNGYASHLLPHMHGPAGIVPTRGQIIALRANAPPAQLTKSSWDCNEGFEYWFPRPAQVSEETWPPEYPLVILGGGREAAGPEFEWNKTDDSVVNPTVGKALRDFLPELFPDKFESGREPEMEWTGIMGYTRIRDPFVGPVIDTGTHSLGSFKGHFISAGYSGHGMPRAYACAEAVAGMIIAERTGEKWTPPEWLPRNFLTSTRAEN